MPPESERNHPHKGNDIPALPRMAVLAGIIALLVLTRRLPVLAVVVAGFA